ncbi:hypothetical protein [Mobilibacterium timonense]|uniref:hypothetical protein n=2 Tax=Mobilibacterium timonense TaxID=1871012 RepID=UPI000984E8A5|nr:hypothetical protein [Mobilibacterium timonense]MBM6991568.1 hypothetical protein [Mobilibacterium timonense]
MVPMVICHIMCEFCIVDEKLIVFVSDESPVEGMLRTPIDGYNLIEKVSNNDEFLQEWSEEYLPEYEREIIIIK